MILTSINVHGCDRIEATVNDLGRDGGVLNLRVGKTVVEAVSLFMDMERARAIAKAINDAETDHAEAKRAASACVHVPADHRYTAGEEDYRPVPRLMLSVDEQNEHRLSRAQMGV
jgi:ribosome-binding factor A